MSKRSTEHRRNSFYGSAYRQLMRVQIFALLVAFVIQFILIYLATFHHTPKYYASTLTGREVEIKPFSDPILTTKFIRRWAETAARSALNLSFSNYRQELQKASGFFTSDAWSQYMDVIESRGLLSQINDSQLIISAIATQTPTILYRRVHNGHYTWRIQAPLLVGIQTSGSKAYQRWVVTMTIVRVSTLETPRGILINEIEVH